MLNFAIQIASGQKVVKDHFRLAAIVTDKRGRVLSTGRNSYFKTHPKQLFYSKQVGRDAKIYLHAEIAALVKVHYGKPHKIYIARVNNFGEARNAYPCLGCQKAIKDMGIKEIITT